MKRCLTRWVMLICCLFFCGMIFGCGDDDDDNDDNDASPADDDDNNGSPPEDDDDNDDDASPADPFADIPIDATYSFAALSAPVEVLQDEYGIPHLYAANEKDLSFVLGYLSARDRMFSMDMLRRFATGKLSEFFGLLALDTDVATRAQFLAANGQPVYEQIDPILPDDQRIWLQAYADGFNRYLNDIRENRNGATLPPQYSEFLIGLTGVTAEWIADWTIEDIFALARLQQWDLSKSAGYEIYLGEYFASVPADVWTDTMRFKPAADTTIIPSAKDRPTPCAGRSAAPALDLQRLRTALENLPAYYDVKRDFSAVGSNNWVVDDGQTATGGPLLANDPHLSLVNPPNFYEVHLNTDLFGEADGLNAYGVIFPGIPAIMIGMNDNLAWGVTNVAYDVEDVYVETLNGDQTAVQFNGDWVDIEYSEQKFRMGPGPDADTVTKEIPYLPHHGAFLNGSLDASGGMTVRWTGHDVTNDLPAFLNLLFAADIDDFFAAVGNFTTGAQNFIAFDRSGNIGYYPHAHVPIRDNVSAAAPPYLPLPGDGEHEWLGYIPSEELPKLLNPASGYIVTANNDIVGNLLDNDPLNDEYYLYATMAEGLRAERIVELLEAGLGNLTLENMLAVQNDTLSPEGRRFLEYLLQAATDRPDLVADLDLTAALERLEAWDFSTPAGVEGASVTIPVTDQDRASSVACTIFYTFMTRLPAAVFGDEFAGYGDGTLLPDRNAVWYLLEHSAEAATGETLFDDINTAEVETPEDILLQTLADATAWCASADGFNTEDMSQWLYGKIHVTQWEDFYGNLDSALVQDLKGPYPLDGAPYTVDVAGYSGVDDFVTWDGSNVRWAVSLVDDEMTALSVLPGGENERRASSHYNDQALLWLNNGMHQSLFQTEEVIEHAAERYRFEPVK